MVLSSDSNTRLQRLCLHVTAAAQTMVLLRPSGFLEPITSRQQLLKTHY